MYAPARMEGFDGYIRVSRVGKREGESFISPTDQREQIERWARLRNVEIAAWHTDLDETGGKLGRPGLDALMDRVRTGQTGGIAVAYLDRLSRAGVADALRLVEEIYEAGGKIAVIELGIDPTTPFGEFAMTIMLALARMQRRQITEKWDTARRRAVERGVHVASRTPTGYERDDSGRLVPHPTDGAVIGEVFTRKASGASWATLTALLDERGVVGPYQAVQWTQRAVSHIIANRVYLGEARSGEYVNRAAHDALVDRATWEAAQRTEALPAVRGAPALLAGLLRCAGCRHLMKPDHQRMRDGTRARTYRCRGHHAAGTCTSRAMVLGSVIEPWVDAQVRARIADAAPIRAASVAANAELEAVLVGITDAETDLEAFRDDERIVGVLGADRYVEGLQARARRVDDLHAQAAALRARAAGPGTLTAGLLEMWDDLTVEERQRAFRGVIDAVMLRSVGQVNTPIASRALVLWRGEAPDDFPARGKRRPLKPFVWPNDAP